MTFKEQILLLSVNKTTSFVLLFTRIPTVRAREVPQVIIFLGEVSEA
jgi:hypothetical protein